MSMDRDLLPKNIQINLSDTQWVLLAVFVAVV